MKFVILLLHSIVGGGGGDLLFELDKRERVDIFFYVILVKQFQDQSVPSVLKTENKST